MGICRNAGFRIVLAIALLTALPASAGVVRQITDLLTTKANLGVMDDSGSVHFVTQSSDPYGGNPERLLQLYRYDTVTGAGAQITNLPTGITGCTSYGPSVTDDGGRILFASTADPIGGNQDGSVELFLVDGDGSNIFQVTSTAMENSGELGLCHISGSGNRIVFQSSGDLTGSNPQKVGQVFVVDADGTSLLQLTSFATDNYWLVHPTISDDGNRITFVSHENVTPGDTQVFGILADGSDLRQLTSFSGQNHFAQISGDGSTVAFVSDGSFPGCPGGCDHDKVVVVNWDGTGLECLRALCTTNNYWAQSWPPDITDDGQTVFYGGLDLGQVNNHPCCNFEVYRVERDGTGWVQLTDTGSGPDPIAGCYGVHVSGNGSTIAFGCSGGAPFGGSNDDLGGELYLGSSTGTGHYQLTDLTDGYSYSPDITPDGSRIVYATSTNPLEEPGFHYDQMYRSSPDGSDLVRITDFDHGRIGGVSVSNDGSKIVFSYHEDPLGIDLAPTFQIHSIQADGTQLQQITPSDETGRSAQPHLSGNGAVVVLVSVADLLNEGLPGYWKVYKMNFDGTGVVRLSSGSGNASRPKVDDTGTFASYSDFGRVYRIRTDGTERTPISTVGVSDYPDISSDGTMIAYQVGTDATMADAQLHLWEQSTGTSRPLTSTATGSNIVPSFSGDGNWIYFWSDAPHFADDHLGCAEQYRIHVGTGTVERVGGLSSCRWDLSIATPLPMNINHDGSLAVFASQENYTGRNRDLSEEVVLIDRNTPALIRISSGPAPTTVTWDVESGPATYDVLRGDVAGLGPDGAGGIDLGAVLCVENDSGDNSTAGFEDPDAPVSGQVLFYLYRGSQGPADPGSYGQSSAGEERLPSAGDCE